MCMFRHLFPATNDIKEQNKEIRECLSSNTNEIKEYLSNVFMVNIVSLIVTTLLLLSILALVVYGQWKNNKGPAQVKITLIS